MIIFIRYSLFTLLISTSFTSCRKFEQEKVVARAEPFVPTNLYPIERLPNYFNRVITLPCYYPDENSGMLKYIDDIFHQELTQERIFETIRINPKQMKEYCTKEDMDSLHSLKIYHTTSITNSIDFCLSFGKTITPFCPFVHNLTFYARIRMMRSAIIDRFTAT